MTLRCIIVDDEPQASAILATYIAKLAHLELCATCKNALIAKSVLSEQKIDLMYLDVSMPQLTGINFLRTLVHPPKVIFTTAYRNFAAESYELDAVDYLVKPFSFDRFARATNKARLTADIFAGYEHGNLANYKINSESFLYFRIDKAMQKVYLEEVAYIESAKDYSKLFFCDGKFILVKQSISSLENMLSSHRFIRAHRSYIVALNKIRSFSHSHLVVGKHTIPVGRLYKSAMLQMLGQNCA